MYIKTKRIRITVSMSKAPVLFKLNLLRKFTLFILQRVTIVCTKV